LILLTHIFHGQPMNSGKEFFFFWASACCVIFFIWKYLYIFWDWLLLSDTEQKESMVVACVAQEIVSKKIITHFAFDLFVLDSKAFMSFACLVGFAVVNAEMLFLLTGGASSTLTISKICMFQFFISLLNGTQTTTKNVKFKTRATQKVLSFLKYFYLCRYFIHFSLVIVKYKKCFYKIFNFSLSKYHTIHDHH
jgi:hypothetical protein